MTISKWLAASVIAVFFLGCASQKDPAAQAIAKIDSSLAAVHDAAAKYVPDALQSVEAQVATLKDELSKGEYKTVLSRAPAVSSAVANLRQAAIAKQEEADTKVAQLKQQWRTMSAEVPKMVSAIKSRIDELSKARRLPKGVNKTSFESAKAGFASLNSTWTEAMAATANQDYAGAIAKGQASKDKATEIMHQLGMASSSP